MSGAGLAFRYPDDARRMADAHNLHLSVQGLAAVGKWIAVRLSDGGTDGVLYDTRKDAIRHQLHESLCTYVEIQPEGLSPRVAVVLLKFARQAYDAGLRMVDPDDVPPGSIPRPINF